jgi:hypothetical protein
MALEPIESPVAQPIEHQNVPVEHRGLHEFLYSSDDEHGASASQLPAAVIPVAAADAVVAIEVWCEGAGDAKVAGVYGVFDRDRRLQYVNISRNVSLSLRGHQAQLGTELCSFVRVATFKFPKREEMAAVQADWIAENGVVPIGNADGDGLWAVTTGDAAISAMSVAERAAYEEKKLKLRKAMADSTLSREPVVAEVGAGDDWSGVIRSQTEETV